MTNRLPSYLVTLPILLLFLVPQTIAQTKDYPNDGIVHDIYGWHSNTTKTPWIPGPDSRGTLDIALSCLATLLLCTWTAIHTVIPPNLGWRQGMFNKLWWVFVGICWPEYLFGCAFKEFWEVRKMRDTLAELRKEKTGEGTAEPETKAKTETAGEKEIETVSEDVVTVVEEEVTGIVKPSDYPRPSMVLAHFIMMGGYVIKPDENFPGLPLILTPLGFCVLFAGGHIRARDLDINAIEDKSKMDGFSKLFVWVQVGWFLVQFFARRTVDWQMVSGLEAGLLVHVITTLIIYALWYSKPHSVECPILLDLKDKAACQMYFQHFSPYRSPPLAASDLEKADSKEISEKVTEKRRDSVPSPLQEAQTDGWSKFERANNGLTFRVMRYVGKGQMEGTFLPFLYNNRNELPEALADELRTSSQVLNSLVPDKSRHEIVLGCWKNSDTHENRPFTTTLAPMRSRRFARRVSSHKLLKLLSSSWILVACQLGLTGVFHYFTLAYMTADYFTRDWEMLWLKVVVCLSIICSVIGAFVHFPPQVMAERAHRVWRKSEGLHWVVTHVRNVVFAVVLFARLLQLIAMFYTLLLAPLEVFWSTDWPAYFPHFG